MRRLVVLRTSSGVAHGDDSDQVKDTRVQCVCAFRLKYGEVARPWVARSVPRREGESQEPERKERGQLGQIGPREEETSNNSKTEKNLARRRNSSGKYFRGEEGITDYRFDRAPARLAPAGGSGGLLRINFTSAHCDHGW